MTRPAWWTPADDAALALDRELREAGDRLPDPCPPEQGALFGAIPRNSRGDADRAWRAWEADPMWSRWARETTCRRCRWWESADGETGECRGPELALGRTRGGDSCEQWAGVEASGEARA